LTNVPAEANTLATPVIVGGEVFGTAGGAALNDASATALTVVAGGSVLFGTQLFGGFSPDSNLAPGRFQGSARVLTTASSKASTQILCSAFLADSLNTPPSN
jgi:hypothetical protein